MPATSRREERRQEAQHATRTGPLQTEPGPPPRTARESRDDRSHARTRRTKPYHPHARTGARPLDARARRQEPERRGERVEPRPASVGTPYKPPPPKTSLPFLPYLAKPPSLPFCPANATAESNPRRRSRIRFHRRSRALRRPRRSRRSSRQVTPRAPALPPRSVSRSSHRCP